MSVAESMFAISVHTSIDKAQVISLVADMLKHLSQVERAEVISDNFCTACYTDKIPCYCNSKYDE